MWLAATSSGGSSPISINWTQLIQYGVLGMVVLGAILGFIWFKPSVDKLIEERDRLIKEKAAVEVQRDAMAQIMQDKLLPVVGEFIATTNALSPLFQQIVVLGPKLSDLVEDVARNVQSPPRPPRQPRR